MKPKTVGRQGDNETTPFPEYQGGLMATGMILTPAGELPVAALVPGQRVITRDSGIAVIRTLYRRRVRADAVRILAGSLGHTRPDSDVILPADQRVLVRDWRAQALFGAPQAIVPARRLIDGEFVSALGGIDLDLYDIEFDRPHILYVDGIEVVTNAAAPSNAIAA